MQRIILNTHIVLKHPVLLQDEIEAIFTIVNPEYKSICQQRRLSKAKQPIGYIVTKYKKDGKWKSKKVPQHLRYYSINKKDILIPRGAFFELKKLYKKHNIKYKLINERNQLPDIDIKFHGELDPKKGQLAILKWNAKNGILKSPTGSGKTVMSLFVAAQLKQPFCVVIDTKELLNQWVKRIETFLNIKKSKIGTIGSGLLNPKPITVALMQTLKKHPNLLDNWGFLIVDECEIAACDSYGKILNNFNGQYVMGDSATPKRKDGKTKPMLWYLGNIKVKVDYEKAEKTPCIATFVGTDYKTEDNFRSNYSNSLVNLQNDEDRNKLIINTVLENIDFFGVHLIMSKSSIHLQILLDMFPHHFQLISKMLIGTVKDKERIKIVKLMEKNKIKFIFCTTALLKKGFDEELLSILHLVTPMKDPTQPVGRIRRVPKTDEIKKLKTGSLIFDYFDRYCNTLRGSASKRSKIYKKLGIEKRIG